MAENINKTAKTGETLPDKYDLQVSNPAETGARLYSLKSEETDITAVFVEFNSDYDIHAAVPWAGARTSRSDDPHEKIYSEILEVTHSDKIDMFFGYGHASIANMSPTMIHLNNLPMREAYWIFNHLTLVGGQETSTRYVELSNPTVTPLEQLTDLDGLTEEERQQLINDWNQLGEKAHAGFNKWFPEIRDGLLGYVRSRKPDTPDKAMDKRALDAARAWLPLGGKTSMSLQFDVREAINLITQLNQREDYYGSELSEQLTTLYRLKQHEGAEDIQADLAGLMKYTEGSDTVDRNTARLKEILEDIPLYEALKEYSMDKVHTEPVAVESRVEFVGANYMEDPGNEVIAGYVMTLLPNLRYREAANFANRLSGDKRQELLSAIFDGHTQHDVLRNAADWRGHTVEVNTALAYQRDFNRHRAMGRLAVMLDSANYDATTKTGFNRSHVLSRTDALKGREDEWNQEMADLYQDIYRFYERAKVALGEETDMSFIQHILPLGHQSNLAMSGPLMQWNYLTHLRIRPGGDYGYRDVTYDLAKAIRQRTGLGSEKTSVAPDYNDVDELLDRS